MQTVVSAGTSNTQPWRRPVLLTVLLRTSSFVSHEPQVETPPAQLRQVPPKEAKLSAQAPSRNTRLVVRPS